MTSTATEAPASVEAFGYKQELRRSLSLLDLLVYGLVFIVPSAPISVFGLVYNASNGMVPLVYIVGLVAMLFTASSYVAMSRIFPVSGSVYAYAGRAIGDSAGFIAGWMLLLDYLFIPSLVYILIAVAISSVIPEVPPWVWMVALLGLNTAVNLFGIENTARFNFAMLALQMVMLVIFGVTAFVSLSHHVAGAHLSLLPIVNPGRISLHVIFGALSLAVLSFLGFDAISTLTEEAKGGGEAVGKATMLTLIVCALLFVAQTYLMCLFVLGKPGFPPGDATAKAPYVVMALIGGPWLKFLVAIIGVVITGIPAALAPQAAVARLLYSMGRDGKLPRVIAHVSPVRQVPNVAIVFVACVTLVLSLAFYHFIDTLTSMVNFGALSGFVLLHISVIAQFVWRQKSRQWGRYLLVPLCGLAIIGYVLWNMEPLAKTVGLSWLGAGVLAVVTLKLLHRKTTLPME